MAETMFESRVLADTPAIDPEAIEQLRFLEDEDQPNVVAELVALFVEHTPPKLKQLAEAIETHDLGALRRAAHSLKGSSANVGARGMQHVCEQLEHNPPEAFDQAPALLVLLEAEFAIVEPALNAAI
jgi:HPt (histidine-containing phosphotransfer) domain-containing protein